MIDFFAALTAGEAVVQAIPAIKLALCNHIRDSRPATRYQQAVRIAVAVASATLDEMLPNHGGDEIVGEFSRLLHAFFPDQQVGDLTANLDTLSAPQATPPLVPPASGPVE